MFGCDPEMFCYYTGKEGGLYALSPITLETEYGFMPIVNHRKHPTYFNNGEAKIIMDGAAFEINLLKPQKYADEMLKICKKTMAEFSQHLEQRTGFQVIAVPSIKFDFERWWTIDVDFNERALQGFIFGCDHSYNAKEAIERGENEYCNPEIDARHWPYRYGGGHIHFSDDLLVDRVLQAVRLMDIYLGTFFMSMSTYKDEEIERCKIYGKPGGYRVQQYSDGSKGVEYRTCSNNWLNMDVTDFLQVETLIDKVKTVVTDKAKLEKVFKEFQEKADMAIQTANFGLCYNIWNEALEI